MTTGLINTVYTNPVVDDDFPDPSILEVPGQGFYAYATHDDFSPTLNNILVRHSADLVHWSAATGALVKAPVWAKSCTRFWCPHVVKVGNEYRLYYAAESDTKDGMCLAMARGTDPLHYTDMGRPLSTMPGSTYQMIDPYCFIDPATNKTYLYYGSAHEPIRVVELATDGLTFFGEPVAVLYPFDKPFERLREGAFVTYQPKWKRYLMWVSGDNTWIEQGYAITVFWSTEPMVEFRPIPGNYVVLQANAQWDSPGQNCIIQDHAGEDWMVYHAVDKSDRFIAGTSIFKRKMCMDKVQYTNEGWPYIDQGNPGIGKQNGPAVLKGDEQQRMNNEI